MFSCAYCEIFKNRFFYRTTRAAASDISRYEISIVKLRKQRRKECLIINNICQKTCHINPSLGGGGDWGGRGNFTLPVGFPLITQER